MTIVEFLMGPYFAATAIVALLYLFVGYAVRRRWLPKQIVFDPLKIVAGTNRKVSLSSAQTFFFTLIVLWLVIFWVWKEQGVLVPLNTSILALLGIAVIGAGTGKISDTTRSRPAPENLTWAVKKEWIKQDFTQTKSDHKPVLADLITTNGEFDIARFQAVGFSLAVGFALLYNGITAETAEVFSQFTISETYLALIGISQGAYVGGKFVGENHFKGLNTLLQEVRKLEIEFRVAVANSTDWKDAAQTDRNMTLARNCAPEQHIKYMTAAREAAGLVGRMTGNPIDDARIEPDLQDIV